MSEYDELIGPRRLFPFDPRRVPHYRFDALVVGAGAAGGAAALAMAERGLSVGLIAKAGLEEANTFYAQGGLAAVIAPEDSFEAHVEDTLRVGCGLSERTVVEEVVRGGPRAVEALLAWGADFDRLEGGDLDLSREGGHSHRRVVHARGDSTGQEIQAALIQALSSHSGISTFESTFVIDLLQGAGGEVLGVLAWSARGEPVAFLADQVVLATGGAGQIYRETTNPAIATGDGVALGFRAGAVVRDLEFFQFHPTCLYIAGAARVLISEIVRGAGGVLVDKNGERFMSSYHPDAELAPRDVVSRAVFERMVLTGDTNVYLDLSGVERDPHRLFPGISRICRFFGIDIAHDPVPVRPGAHYMIGGLSVDERGRTSVPGLLAVGECASTGLHGANRMGSNSLLEALVLGARAGDHVASLGTVGQGSWQPRGVLPIPERAQPTPGIQVHIGDVTYSLKSLMWRALGVVRDGEEIREAQSRIDLWTRAVRELAPPEARSWELLNMLTLARLTSIGALAREESRGVHYRTDYPEAREEWRVHTELAPIVDGEGIVGVQVERVPLPVDPSPQQTETTVPLG